MSGDIRALTPLSSMPLVREKRHYPGEQKKDQYKKKQQHGSTNNQERVDDPAIANIRRVRVETAGHVPLDSV